MKISTNTTIHVKSTSTDSLAITADTINYDLSGWTVA